MSEKSGEAAPIQYSTEFNSGGGNSADELLRAMNDGLHALSQPMTALCACWSTVPAWRRVTR